MVEEPLGENHDSSIVAGIIKSLGTALMVIKLWTEVNTPRPST